MTNKGRPSEVDARQIVQVAVRLFERHGFNGVTMEDIAAAASISRRTLFRHFPSKADLVWADTDEVLSLMQSLGATLEVRGLRVVDDLIAPVLSLLDDPNIEDLARRRLLLIARAPAL